MKETTRHQLWIVVVAAALFFPSLGTTRLWDDDEAYFAGTAAEMYSLGEWTVPYFNGEVFGHKPPWMYWMMMTGFALFGKCEFAARFFSAVCGLAICLLAYHFGRRQFNPRVGFLAGIILATSPMFNVVSRAATPDVYLTFFVMLSLFVFATAGRPDSASQSPSARRPPAISLPRRWSGFALMYAVMGLAMLVKGPIGVLFPMAVIGLFLLCTSPRRSTGDGTARWKRWIEACRPFGPVNFLRTVWRMRPFTAAAVVLLVAGPWYYLVGVRTDGVFLREFFYVHHFQRLTTPMESHGGSIFYYVVAVLVGTFPWSIFATPILIRFLRPSSRGPSGQDPPNRNGSEHDADDWAPRLLLICWVGVYIGLFSLASTKLPNYVLPAYPAVALMAAYFFDGWLRQPDRLHVAWPRAAFGILVFVGVAVLIGFPAVASYRVDGRSLLEQMGLASRLTPLLKPLWLVGLPAVVGGVVALVLSERRRANAATISLGVTSFATLLIAWNYAVPSVDGCQTSPQIASTIREHCSSIPPRVSQYGYFRPSLVYYTAGQVENCPNRRSARDFLSSPTGRFLITTDEHFPNLRQALPFPVEVVERLPRFPKKGAILLLRRNSTDRRRTPIRVGSVENGQRR